MITPLPAARPSALITTGKPRPSGKGFGGGRVAEAAIGGGGNADFGAKVFDEALGAFQHRGGLGRPQGADAGRLEHVPQPAHQLGVGGDHGEIDSLGLARIPPGPGNRWPGWARIPPPAAMPALPGAQ